MVDRTKYTLKIEKKEKPFKVSKEVKEMLKGAVSPKMMKTMKYESIPCPILSDEVAFLECFLCESFIRRFKGEVHCAGIKGPR